MIAPARVRTRVTFFSDAEYFGGAEGYLSLLARHLDRERFELDCVLPPVEGAGVLAGRMEAAGVRLHRLPRLGLQWPARVASAVRLLREIGGDVLHLNLPSVYDGGVSSVVWAARQAGYGRVVTTEHLPMVARRYKTFVAKLFFTQWVDRVIVNTESNRRFLVRRHGLAPEQIAVVDNGVEEAPSLPPAERERLRDAWNAGGAVVIGIVGRLTRRKGQHFRREALAGLAREDGLPPWVLVVAGEGEEGATLRAQGTALEAAGRVVWLGHRADAPSLMQAFDLLVLPSTIETMPFALIEAMAAGRPVAASAIFGIPELIVPGRTGLLLPPGDVPALRDALRRLLLDPGMRRTMGEQGRRRFEERFTAARMTEATAAIYQGAGAVRSEACASSR